MDSDKQLIKDYLKKKNEQALQILIGKYLSPVYNFVFQYTNDPHEAQDIVQETFIKAWRHLKRFKSRKNFRTWIFQIAKNTAIDFYRKRRNIPFSDFENEKEENILIEKVADPGPLPDEILEKSDLRERLTGIVRKLPVNYRNVVFLHYHHHFTFQEIANILSEPLNTVKSRHFRALSILKKILEKEFSH